jgi:polar amino acid transport system substrate-binding protein
MTKAFQKLLSILFIICCPTTIFASEVTVVTAHLAPFQIVNSTSITGLSTEIVKATLDVSGLDYNIEAYEWSLSFNRARQEPNVCIYSLARIPARNTLFHWVGHITSSMVSLYSLANNSLFIDNIDDAKKHMTAVIKDDVIHHYLLDIGFEEGKNRT